MDLPGKDISDSHKLPKIIMNSNFPFMLQSSDRMEYNVDVIWEEMIILE